MWARAEIIQLVILFGAITKTDCFQNRLLRGCHVTELFSSRLPFKAGLVKSFVGESEQSPRRVGYACSEASYSMHRRRYPRFTGYFVFPD